MRIVLGPTSSGTWLLVQPPMAHSHPTRGCSKRIPVWPLPRTKSELNPWMDPQHP